MDIGRSGGSSCGTATSFALYVPLTNTSGRPWTLRSVEAGAARDADLEMGIVGANATGEKAVQDIPQDRARVAFLTQGKEPDSFHPEVAEGAVVKPGDTVIAVVSAAGTSRDRLAGFQGLTVTYTEGDAEKKVTVDDAVWGAHPDISDACGTAPNRVTAG